MRVSSECNAGKLAGAVVGLLRAGEMAVLEAIGANATYKAVKSIDICRVFLKDEGIVPVITTETIKRNINGVERSTMLLTVRGVKNEER